MNFDEISSRIKQTENEILNIQQNIEQLRKQHFSYGRGEEEDGSEQERGRNRFGNFGNSNRGNSGFRDTGNVREFF
jgi:hypothetical protein